LTWQEILTLVATLLIGGPLASWIIQRIKSAGWSDKVKALLAWVVSFAVGLAGAWLAGDILGLVSKWGGLTAVDVLAFGTVVWTGATAFFYAYYQPKQRADTTAPGA
jgi:hypothetical protein